MAADEATQLIGNTAGDALEYVEKPDLARVLEESVAILRTGVWQGARVTDAQHRSNSRDNRKNALDILFCDIGSSTSLGLVDVLRTVPVILSHESVLALLVTSAAAVGFGLFRLGPYGSEINALQEIFVSTVLTSSAIDYSNKSIVMTLIVAVDVNVLIGEPVFCQVKHQCRVISIRIRPVRKLWGKRKDS